MNTKMPRITFEQYDLQNPRVWDLFKQFTFDVIRAGHTRFSANSILRRIRWETTVVTTDSHYKINNNFSADYACKFTQECPLLRILSSEKMCRLKHSMLHSKNVKTILICAKHSLPRC